MTKSKKKSEHGSAHHLGMRAKHAIKCLAKNARHSHGAPRSLDRQRRAARDDNDKLSDSGENERQDAAQVADRLHSAAIHLLRRVRRQDSASGEGPARLSALSVLVFGGPMTLGQLAAAEQVKPPTMTRIVAGLERSGLARRVADPADARRIRIHATAQGTRLLQQARKRRIEYLAHGLEMLGRQDLAVLHDAVGILESVLKRWE